jgi:hypothetical protein
MFFDGTCSNEIAGDARIAEVQRTWKCITTVPGASWEMIPSKI